ncbi:MAG: InlB B-repeat-containing protein, partial [Bacteroidales bacterium]|nr:InlB B-repeat-containing protein [Bacteroidales bacterium]
MTNFYAGTRHISRLFSRMGILLGAFLFMCNFLYARADVRPYGDKNPAARQYNVCHNYAQHLTVAGNMPVTANVSAVPVKANTPDGKPAVAAYDITITDGGREWQPAPGDPVLVTLTDAKFVDGKLLDIYHQGPEGPEFVATVMPKNGTITFPGYSFSVYIVGESHNKDRVKVVFKNGGTEIASYYVKPDDRTPDTMFKKIVYDPGVGTLNEGEFFRGWTKTQNYTAATADSAMTIVGVREDIRTLLGGSFSDGTVVTYYALIYKSFAVTYRDEFNVVLTTDNILIKRDQSSSPYMVNMDYTPADDEHALVGWKVSDGASHITPVDTVYKNGDELTITGDVTFSVKAPRGQWLVFHENRRGATYVAPDFILAGENTQAPTATMECLGYTFGGWYTNEACTGSQFDFGHPLTERTHLYAKWIPVATARYSIIIWKQNIDGVEYDFEELISATGNVGSSAGTIVAQGSGNNAYARINGTNYQYTGFHLKQYDQGVTITPEGTALVNVFYDRTEYTLHFQTYDYTYTALTGTDNDNNPYKYGIVNGAYARVYWTNGAFRISNSSSAQIYTGTIYTRSNSQSWHDSKTITALYGQSIQDSFPITGYDNYSWEVYSQESNYFSIGTEMTFLNMMPNVNATFRGSEDAGYYTYPVNYYVEVLPGETGTETYDGIDYTLYYNVIWRSTRTGLVSTFEEDFVNLLGFERKTSNPAFDQWNANGRASLTPNVGISFYYTRVKSSINYMDGSYYNGNDVMMNDQPSLGSIHVVNNIIYGTDISSYGNYVPETTPAGFVFEGWYVDKTCTHPYTFNKMPSNSITVYAKWRQIQYRVFLHPNAGTDATLDWGSDNQAMNFRISYGGKVNTPEGTREKYEFVGWYKDAACHNVFNGEAFVLNETTVTTPYNKTVDMTDPMDKFGNGATWNSDSMLNATTVRNPKRFWITKKLDLYAKWRQVIAGAKGIQITYNAGSGSNAPYTTSLYKDNTAAIADHASTPSTTDSIFSYWEVMKWNGSTYVPSGATVYPGGDFDVLLENAKFDRTDNGSGWDTTYTVQLKAHYELKERKTPTFIVWYNNYKDAPTDTLRQDGNKAGETAHADLHINEAVSIPTPADREGFTFLGWYRKKWTNAADVKDTIKVCEPDFLYYNNTTNKYYKEQAYTNEATQVAADEANPYDYLYAIWVPDTITFNIPDEFCYGAESGTYTLPTTSIEGITGTWNPATINTTEPNTYYPIFTPDNGQCIINKQVKETIIVRTRTEATISGPTEICSGKSATLSVPDVTGNTYKWSTNATIDSIVVSPTTTTVYKVTVTSGGCESEGTHTLTVNELPVVNSITVPTGNICPGSGPFTVTGNVTPGTGTIATYTWGGDATAANAASTTVAEPTSGSKRCDTTYNVSLKVVDNKGCESNTATNSFNVKDEAAPTIGTDNLNRTLTSTSCTFTVPDLTDEVRAISTDACTPRAALNITQTPAAGTTLEAGSSQVVVVTVTDLCGKYSTKNITLTVPGKPTVGILGDANVCYNGTLELTAEGNGGTGTLQYKWSDNSTLNPLTLNNQTDTAHTQTVSVTVTDANGCTATVDHSYNVYRPLRGGRILYEKHACNTGDTVVVVTGTTAATGGGTGKYVWQSSTDNSTFNDIVPEVNTESYTLPAIHHLYIRRAYITACGTVYTNVVYIENSGNVDVGTMTGDASTAYCYGSNVSHTMTASSVTLASGSPFNYQWYTSTDGENWTQILGADGSSYTYTQNPFTQSTSIYFKYAIAITGCDVIFANQQVQLDVNPLPTVTVTSNTTQTIDLGESITDVVVDYANGGLFISGEPAGVTYTSTAAHPVTISGRPEAAGIYKVVATVEDTTSHNCGTAVDSFKIIVNDTLVLEPFSFDPTLMCVQSSETNNQITISESAGNTTDYTYTWDPGANGTIVSGQGTKEIVAQWSSSGDKIVKLTVKNNTTNAESHKSAVITVNPVPAISIDDIAEVCPGTAFNVKGKVTTETAAPYTYSWSTTSTGLTVTPASATVTATAYTSTATATGCGETKELKLTVKDNRSCQVSTTKNITTKTPAAPTVAIASTSTLQETNDLGCNPGTIPTPATTDFTVTDECKADAVVTLTEGTETVNNCIHTKMWTASYKNACDVTASKSITFTWKEMTTPSITTSLTSGTKECNWDYNTYGPKQSDFTVTDDCASGATATVTPGTLDESVACQRSMTWKATYQNACGMKADTVTITYTWPYDVTKPVITAFDTVATPKLNCKYEMPDLSVSTLHRTTDGCSTPTFVSQSVDAGTLYAQTAYVQNIEVTVTVKDDCNNEQTAIVNVTIPAKMTVTAQASPATICKGNTSTLTATPTSATGTPSYTWTDASTLSANTGATVTATPTATTTYTVNAQDENGCTATATVQVKVDNPLTISIDPADQYVCFTAPNTTPDAIQTITVTTETGNTLTASGLPTGVNLSGTTITGTPSAPNTYNYTVEASNTASVCPAVSATGTIVVPQQLKITNAAATNATCVNNDGKVTVTATGGTGAYTYSYAYKYPAATHNTAVNLSTKTGASPTGLDTAVYVVTVKDEKNCETTYEFTIGLTNDLTVTVSTEPQHICSGGSFVITPSAPTGTTYTWGLPMQSVAGGVTGTAAGTDQTTVHGENLVNNTTSTVELTYTVKPTYGLCVGAATPVTVAVDVTTHPVPTITLKDTTVCANIGNVGLTATFASVTAAVDTVSWKFLADSVAHLNAVSSSDLTDNYTAAVPATPCNNQTYPYVVYYADQYGCHSQATANVIVSLPAAITITGGTNASTIECAADTVAPHTLAGVMPTVKDACDNDISDQWTLARPTNKVECEGTMEFVYTYKNCDDKTASWTYTYTIKRATPPAEDGGPVANTATVECLADATAPATLPVVKDVCGKEISAPTPTVTDNIAGCEGTRTYTYIYKDCVDSQFVWNFVYTIERTTKPTVNATGIEAAKTVACVDSAKAPATIPTATGKCESAPITGVLTGTVDSPSPLTCEGTRTYTYTYTDCAGDTAQWNYVYTITKGDFTMPANERSDIACASDTVMPTPPATPADYCGDLTVTGPVRGGTFNGCSGTKTYTWTYTDCSGNYTHNWTYTYNIAKPAAPALTGTWPSDQTDVNSCYADRPDFPTKAAVKALYTASCGKTLTVDSVETVVITNNCNWEIQCEYTITDGCTPVTNTITYKGGDKTKPAIGTGYTATLPANVTSCNYTYPDFRASVKSVSSDLCTAQADLTVTQNPAEGSSITLTDAEQTLPVKVYVADACGNKDSVTVTVTVPASIALTIDTSASDCYNTADGFLNYTITGGVADYTLELTGPTAGTATQAAAGSYSFTGLADGSYTLKVTDANGCYTQKSTTIQQIATTLSIVANSHNWTYDGSAHSDNGFKVTFGSESHNGTSGTDVTLDNGDVITGVTVSGSITNVAESPVANALGTGIKVMRGTRDVTCFYNIDTTFGKLTITNSGDLALNCVDQSKTFDGTALSYTAVPTVTTGTTVSYSTDGGATWSTTVPSITNVSESPLTVNVKAENSNYTTATCSYKLTINPATLTIKLDSTKIYDGTAFVSDYASTPAGYTITGLVSGDAVTAGAVTSSDIHKGDYVYDATATISTPFATTKGIGNYNVTYDLTQHIVCRDVTLTSATDSRKYDGTALTDNTVTVSGSGWLSGKEATYSDFATITDKGSKNNAFTYTLAAGELASDYCVTIDTGKLTVNCREITITAASLTNIPYDGNVHSSSAFTVTGDGMVSGESVTPVIEGSIQFPSQSPQTNAITSYTFTPATTTDNYCVTTVDGTLTMECVSKTIVITADNGEWTYDGTMHTQNSYTLTVDGGSPITVPLSANGDYKFPNGDSLHVTISGEAKNVTAGVNNVVAGWTLYHGTENLLAAGAGSCYDISKVDGTLKVNCREITLTSGTASKTYDGSALKKETVTIGGAGMVSGESLSYTNFAQITNVGSTDNTFEYSFVSPALASNYCVTDTTYGTLTVDCKKVTIAAKNASRVYNGAPLTESGFTASALESGDTHTFTVVMADTCTITNVGTKANVIATVDGVAVTPGVETAVGNYCVTTSNGTLTVDCKKVTIRAKNASKEYDATPLTQPEFTNTALESGDTHTFTVKMTAASTITDAGTQANVIDTVDGVAVTTGVETAVGNYCVTTEEGTLTVTVVDLPEAVVDMTCPTSGDTTRMYDGTPLAPIVTATSSLSSLDTFHIEYSTDGGTIWSTTPASVTHVSEGTKTVKVRATNPNYKLVYCDFTMQVTCRKDTLLSNAATKVYDGTPLENTTVTVKGDGFVSGETPTYSSFANITDVGKATNTFNYALPTTVDASDYCITVLYDTLEITPAPLTIKLDTQKVYDATVFVSDYTATTDGYTITGLVSGDAITAGVVTSSASDVNTYIDSVTTAEAQVTTPFTTTKGISNYDVTYDLKQVINCKDVTLTAKDSTKVYDGIASTQPGFTATALEATDAHTFTVQMADTCTITNVGTKANVIAKVDGVDITPGTTTTVGNYCVDVVNGTLEITPAPLTIKLDTQKVYDATVFVSDYTATTDGYTITGLVSGDAITAGVVTSSASDVNTYIDSVTTAEAQVTTPFATTKGISNYDVTYDLKQEITCKDVTLTAMDSTKVYDGIASTQPGFTATALEATDAHTFTVQMADTCTITNVGTKANVIAKVDGVDITPGTTTTVGNYCVDVVNGTLEITPAPLTIKLDTQKVYDATVFVSDYTVTTDGYTITGLVSGDAITAGVVTTVSDTVAVYIDSVAPEAKVTTDFATTNGITNYDVTYDLKQEIKCAPVTITANNAGFIYTGAVQSDPNYSVTGLVGSDAIDAVVTGSIQFPQQSPQVNEVTSYVFTTGKASNYCVTTENGQLTMSWGPCWNINIKSNSHTWEFDNTAHTDDGYTLTYGGGVATVGADGIFNFPNGDTLKVDVTGTITYVDTVDNIPVVAGITQKGFDVSPAYCVTLDTGKLIVTPKPITILDTMTTQVYNGDSLRADYDNPNMEAIGLVSGDALTAGQFITQGYKAGYYRATILPTTTAVMAEGAAAISQPFNTTIGIQNYAVTYKAKLTITPRPLEITADDATKVYDCTELTKDSYTVTGGTAVATTDVIDTVFVTGSQLCVGESDNVPSGAIILHGADTVNNSYNITYVNGTLHVTPITTGFSCPPDLEFTLWHSTCDTNVTLPAEATLTPSLPAGCVSITNDLHNPLPAGVHTITWALRDQCDSLMTTCTQTITVNYAKCDTAVDYDGNKYPSER